MLKRTLGEGKKESLFIFSLDAIKIDFLIFSTKIIIQHHHHKSSSLLFDGQYEYPLNSVILITWSVHASCYLHLNNLVLIKSLVKLHPIKHCVRIQIVYLYITTNNDKLDIKYSNMS